MEEDDFLVACFIHLDVIGSLIQIVLFSEDIGGISYILSIDIVQIAGVFYVHLNALVLDGTPYFPPKEYC